MSKLVSELFEMEGNLNLLQASVNYLRNHGNNLEKCSDKSEIKKLIEEATKISELVQMAEKKLDKIATIVQEA